MVLTRLSLKNGKTAPRLEEAALDDLRCAADFASLLERERARADRSSEQFSLLVFQGESSKELRSVLAAVARILRERLRSTDEAGWLDARRIGVVLPATPVEGARILADDVLERFPEKSRRPLCEIYCYPCGLSGGARDVGRRAAARLPSESAAARGLPVGAMETLFMRRMPLWKRAIDVALASTALVLLSPLLVAVGLVVKLTSPGPIFFTQRRSGRGGKPFVIYKFRSMVDGAEAVRRELAALNEQDGPAFKIKADPRVTAVGKVLRATCIDELPQLWNVLRGEMSLVGPRPLPCAESDGCAGWQRRRLDITPGLTCFWQTSDREAISFNEWMRMDVRYARSQSFWQDCRLILNTMGVMLRGNRW